MFVLVVLVFCFPFILVQSDCDRYCGLENSYSRVFYGNEISHRKYPWLTLLSIYKDGKSMLCAGNLIDSKRILTAAHCLYDKNNRKVSTRNIQVFLGAHSVTDTEDGTVSPVKVSHYEINENHLRSHGYDIALLVLKKSVKFTQTVSPICVPAFDTDYSIQDRELTVVGWGISDIWQDDSGQSFLASSDTPMEARVYFVPRERCEQIYASRGAQFSSYVDSSREICAYNFQTYADACSGDSGGPLMYHNYLDGRWYLAGVVARGADCPNHSGIPGTYTKLVSMRRQIERMDTPKDFCQNY
ncbi:clotting factor G beta subunit-like [Brevipalpus obovatus]|uniref:clotting factor G beta subunit-like n=1 Tax=Brevipalpus obovatus TaxID=246614 RepID=UPI003D9EC962